MKKSKLKIGAIFLASLIIAGNIAPAASAIEQSKEEVVYVNITGDGSVKNIDVVNILTADNDGQVVDYGSYSSVRNMTTTDSLDYKDGKLSTKTSAEKLYYDGRLKNNNMPWRITVEYFLDGKKISADQLAGKSGDLRIHVKVTKNTDYTGPDFYRNYSLQGTIKLDTKKCKNIVSDQATIANVGQQKQLSYIALPNKGLDFAINTSVTDFEYDGININGIPLNLKVEIDDSELMSQVTTLQDAIGKVDDGAGKLNAGLQKMRGGLNKATAVVDKIDVQDLTAKLTRAKIALESATLISENGAKLIAASAQIKSAISTLSSNASALAAGVNTNKLDALYQQYGINLNNITSQNAQAITSLQAQINELKAQLEQIKQLDDQAEAIAALEAQIANLENIVKLLQGNSQTIGGADQVTRGFINDVNDKLSALANGASKLEASYTEFDKNLGTFIKALSQLSNIASTVQDIVKSYELDGKLDGNFVASIVAGYNTVLSGMNQLFTGSQKLADGTHTLHNETSNLDSRVNAEIDSLLKTIRGDAHIGSFTSSQNTNVKAVQFVIKSSAIKKPAVAKKTTEETKNENFFDKLFKLFGWS